MPEGSLRSTLSPWRMQARDDGSLGCEEEGRGVVASEAAGAGETCSVAVVAVCGCSASAIQQKTSDVGSGRRATSLRLLRFTRSR